MTIAAAGAVATIGTVAYFTDTETSTGNTFTAGTIDIAVNSQNPWSQSASYKLEDMKPGYVEYTNFTIKNVGTNPTNVWKKVSNITVDENGVNEPECAVYGGTWSGGDKQNGVLGTDCNPYNTSLVKNDLDTVITYDLSVILKDANNNQVWNQTLYNMDKTIAQIAALSDDGMFLGMIPKGWSMEVTESYRMLTTAGNEYQSDKMTFDITLTAKQLTGTLVLEDKDPSNWRVKGENDIKATVEYGVKDATLKIASIAGKVPLTDGQQYSLITYPESFSSPSGAGWPGSGIVLATVTTSEGGITGFAQVNTNPETFTNMKVWLVPTADLNTGATFKSSAWNPANYLFDTGLADYYKSSGI